MTPQDKIFKMSATKIDRVISLKCVLGLGVFRLPISLVMIERIYTLSYYHHQFGSMNYYPFLGLGHETMVCAICLYILIN